MALAVCDCGVLSVNFERCAFRALTAGYQVSTTLSSNHKSLHYAVAPCGRSGLLPRSEQTAPHRGPKLYMQASQVQLSVATQV